MKKAVMNFINKRKLIKPNKIVIVGVSGGPDSMALLHVLKSLQQVYHLRLIALCIDHQLRGTESSAEVQYVKKMCQEWDIPFIAEKVDVISYQNEHQVSIQMAARHLRYECYKRHLKQQSAHYIALGHHADDQLETMLMALSQVTNPAILSGIPVKRSFYSGKLIRPLLCVTKQQINDYCFNNYINPRIDPSNEDDHYMRIFYRKHITPKIKERHANIHKTIQYLSESLSEDEQYLMSEAKKIFESEEIKKDKNKEVSFLLKDFNTYSPSLQRRIYQLILDYLYSGDLPKNLSYVHEETFLNLLEEKKSNTQLNFPNKLQLEKSYDKILLYFTSEKEQPHFHKIIEIPSTIQLPNNAMLTFKQIDHQIDDENEYTYVCPINSLSFPLQIRTRHPGDRMSWKGLNGSKKLKDVFIDEKVPRKERDKKILVTDNDGTILWVIGVKKGIPKNDTIKKSPYIKIIYKESDVQLGGS